MPDCETYLEHISASLDDALTDAERAELGAHLASCPSCRALFEDLAAIRAGCAGWGEESPPEGFAGRVAAAAAAEDAPRKILLFRRYRPLLATAAVAAVVLLAVRTDGFSALTGVRSGAPPAGTDAPAALSDGNDTSAQDGDRSFAAVRGAPVPAPDPGAQAAGGAERSADEEKAVSAGLPAESGSEMMFGTSLYASVPPDTKENALYGRELAPPDLPEGEWAWVLVLAGDEPEWPVDVTPAAEDASARYFSAAASDRAALENAFAARGCVSYADEKTVSGAEKGLICLLAE